MSASFIPHIFLINAVICLHLWINSSNKICFCLTKFLHSCGEVFFYYDDLTLRHFYLSLIRAPLKVTDYVIWFIRRASRSSCVLLTSCRLFEWVPSNVRNASYIKSLHWSVECEYRVLKPVDWFTYEVISHMGEGKQECFIKSNRTVAELQLLFHHVLFYFILLSSFIYTWSHIYELLLFLLSFFNDLCLI